MTALTPPQREKLVRILGMLGSDHGGERASAGLLASRMLKAAKIDWCDLIPPPVRTGPKLHIKARPQPPAESTHWRYKVNLALRKAFALTDWERKFLLSLASQPTLSAKQAAIVDKIARKVAP